MASSIQLRNVITSGLVRFRLIDAKDQVLGRLATHISTILQGKDKPTYQPHLDEGDVVVVINAEKFAVTGRKMTDKVYRWHTGYPGGLKERTLKEQVARKPEEVIRKAVERMLPKNRLRVSRMRKLRLFAGEEHPFPEEELKKWNRPPRPSDIIQKQRENEVLPEGSIPLNPAAYPTFKMPENFTIGGFDQ